MFNISMILLQSTAGVSSQQLILPAAISVIGLILSYVFLVPVLNNKITNISESINLFKLSIEKNNSDISNLKTEHAVLQNTTEKNNKLIDELFDHNEKNTKNFNEMIKQNTEAIIKLEATMKSLNDHTSKLEEIFKQIINKNN
jgi:hypothetical protein